MTVSSRTVTITPAFKWGIFNFATAENPPMDIYTPNKEFHQQ